MKFGITFIQKYFWRGDTQSQNLKEISLKMYESYNNRKFWNWNYLFKNLGIRSPWHYRIIYQCQKDLRNLQKFWNHTNVYGWVLVLFTHYIKTSTFDWNIIIHWIIINYVYYRNLPSNDQNHAEIWLWLTLLKICYLLLKRLCALRKWPIHVGMPI